MRRSKLLARGLVALLLAGGGAVARQDDGAPKAAGPQPAPYQRVVEEDNGAIVKLEMAVREFAPAAPGKPHVYLAGAVHIGEDSFYKGLQEFLDAQSVVLFEGVKPPGAGAAEHDAAAATDEEKRAATKRRVRFIAMAVERYRADHDGKPPASLGQLIDRSEARIASLLKASLEDAWGHDLIYTMGATGAVGAAGAPNYDIVSPGADGNEGGEGAAADVKFSDQKPLSKPETGDRSEGLQQKLADATGWVFQLSAMDHNKPNWRNSDLSVDQVQARLEKAGANADGLFKMLDGSSMFSRLGALLLGIMGSTPDGRAMMRTMLIEVIGQADLAALKLPGKSAAIMDVLVEDRNAVVIDDLKRILEDEPGLKTIAIIYGAGHLPTIEKRLVSELGYTPVGDTWHAAMSVDAKKAGVPPAQLKQVRQMIGKMLERQARQAKARQPN